jgi:hypothetical protein
MAWEDALDFAAAVGDPDEIDFDHWLERAYYGKLHPGMGDDPKELPKYLKSIRGIFTPASTLSSR